MENNEFDEDFTKPRRIKRSKSKKNKSKKRLTFPIQSQRALTAVPKHDKVIVEMIYFGKGLKIPFDTQLFDVNDEISICQQHCGGENLIVYTGMLSEGGGLLKFI